MTLISKRRLAGLASASVMIATVAVAAAPAAAFAATPPPGNPSAGKHAVAYFNTFKSAADADTSGTYPQSNAMFGVTRVESGTNGIKASSGGWYATAGVDAYAFTRYGGYSSIFPTNGYTTSADFYVDVDSVGQFEWSSAISNTSGAHRRDFIFHAGRAAEGMFQVSVSNNSQRNGADGSNPVEISASGWYTFKHEFIKGADNTLSVRMSVTEKGEVAPVRTWTLSDPSDTIGVNGTVGGNRYGWLVTHTFDSVAIDNVTRVQN